MNGIVLRNNEVIHEGSIINSCGTPFLITEIGDNMVKYRRILTSGGLQRPGAILATRLAELNDITVIYACGYHLLCGGLDCF